MLVKRILKLNFKNFGKWVNIFFILQSKLVHIVYLAKNILLLNILCIKIHACFKSISIVLDFSTEISINKIFSGQTCPKNISLNINGIGNCNFYWQILHMIYKPIIVKTEFKRIDHRKSTYVTIFCNLHFIFQFRYINGLILRRKISPQW